MSVVCVGAACLPFLVLQDETSDYTTRGRMPQPPGPRPTGRMGDRIEAPSPILIGARPTAATYCPTQNSNATSSALAADLMRLPAEASENMAEDRLLIPPVPPAGRVLLAKLLVRGSPDCCWC